MNDINRPTTELPIKEQLNLDSKKLHYINDTRKPTYQRSIKATKAALRIGFTTYIKQLLGPIKD